MPRPIFQVDAFTDRAFCGNPAAVCVLEEAADAGWMQNVAVEMNLSETAFIHPAPGGYNLRWFTPALEVDLCGHATLASAHVLWQTGQLPLEDDARFLTRSGPLTARREDGWIELDFPSLPPRPVAAPAGLVEALGIEPRFVGRSRFDYLLEVGTEAEVLRMQPEFRRLAEVETRGVIVTSRSERPGVDFVSRFLAPAAGIDEDPVTGSAHCCLGPFWGERLARENLTGWQASKRGGTVRVGLSGDLVTLAGQAVTVLRGELL